MKNYEETMETVFDRIGKYKAKQMRRKRIILRTVTPLCCLCLVGAAVFGIWQSNQPSTLPEQTLEDALYPGIKDTFDISKGESPDDPAANNKIIVNSIDEISAEHMGIALFRDDFVAMDQDEINSYYGFSFLPELPNDLYPRESTAGIFRRNGGTGDIYYDQNDFNYSNEDTTRAVCMTVARGTLPYFFFRIPTQELEESVINNIEIILAQSSDGWYHAEFLHKNVGFYICACGLSIEEFVDVIASILH